MKRKLNYGGFRYIVVNWSTKTISSRHRTITAAVKKAASDVTLNVADTLCPRCGQFHGLYCGAVYNRISCN